MEWKIKKYGLFNFNIIFEGVFKRIKNGKWKEYENIKDNLKLEGKYVFDKSLTGKQYMNERL